MARRITSGKTDQIKKSVFYWLNLGISPIPIWGTRTGKDPGYEGWQELEVDRKNFRTHFKKGNSIGGLWGKPSGGIIDLDLDWDEAALVAPFILPETFIYGRNKRPGTHYLYRCRSAQNSKWSFLSQKNPILEVRSNGRQSLLPPSKHPDDDVYVIEHEVEIADINQTDLEEKVKNIAIASVFLRKYPEEGMRHDYIHGITGALLHASWDEERVMEVVLAVLKAGPERGTDFKERKRTMTNTIEKFSEKDNTIWGLPKLKTEGFIDQKEQKKLKEWLGSDRFYDEDGAPPSKPREMIPLFPQRLLLVDGLVGEITDWSMKHARYRQPPFHLLVGLMTIALCTRNRYIIGGQHTPLQPYFLSVAETGAGKDVIRNHLNHIIAQQLKRPDMVPSAFLSAQAVRQELTQTLDGFCWVWDEAGADLANANNVDRGVYTSLISAFGQAQGFLGPVRAINHSFDAVDKPFVTVAASSQPTLLHNVLRDQHLLEGGFLGRFLLFDVGSSTGVRNKPMDRIFPSSIKKELVKMMEVPIEPDDPAIEVAMGERLHDRIHAYEDECKAIREVAPLWTRAHQHALIIAGLVAVGINQKRPVITSEILEWSIDLSRWSSSCWEARYREAAGGLTDAYSRKFKRIEQLIRQVRNQVRAANLHPGDKKYKLMIDGYMPRGVLRYLSGIKSSDLEDILDGLIDAGLVHTKETGRYQVYWASAE